MGASVPLLAFANGLGGHCHGCCRLVERGGNLIDVVEGNHGEDEAGRREEGRPVSTIPCPYLLPT